jgi:transcriptional antiterminator RfaH
MKTTHGMAGFSTGDCAGAGEREGEATGSAAFWYVGYTKPRQEGRAAENLLRQGFECRVPVIRAQRRVRRDVVWQEEAMFPRYLFLRPAPCGAPLERVRSTLGMSGLVRFSGVPATVPHDVVEHLVLLGTERREAFFRAGEAVRLVDGPLAGLEAVFECPEGEERAIVLLEFLQRTQRVTVPVRALVRAH